MNFDSKSIYCGDKAALHLSASVCICLLLHFVVNISFQSLREDGSTKPFIWSLSTLPVSNLIALISLDRQQEVDEEKRKPKCRVRLDEGDSWQLKEPTLK